MKLLRFSTAVLLGAIMVSCAHQQYGVHRTDGRRIENNELMSANPIIQDEGSAKALHKQLASDNAKRIGLSVEVVETVFPKYPKDLQAAGVEGVVEVAFTVDKAGRVINPRVVASPHPELSALSLDAIRKWRFKPITKDGVVVELEVRQQFPFKLY